MSARILVVDDVDINVKLLGAKLASEYFDVLTAGGGAAALAVCSAQLPDLVLLDVMMPEMDGFEVCRRLKADPATSHIPVVMVTALSDAADRLTGLEAGAELSENLSPARILLLEDNKLAAARIVETLTTMAGELIHVTTWEEAAER